MLKIIVKRLIQFIILGAVIVGLLITNPSPDEAITWGAQNIVFTGPTTPHGVPEFHLRNNLSIAERNNFFLFSVYHLDVNLSGIYFGSSFGGTPRLQRFRAIGIAGQFFFL